MITKIILILIVLFLIYGMISLIFEKPNEWDINQLQFINISGDYIKIDSIIKFCNYSGKLYISTDTRCFWMNGSRVNYVEYSLRNDEMEAVFDILTNYRR